MRFHLITLAIMLGLGGCASLRPVKDPAVHHLLDATVPGRALTAQVPAIAVKRTTLPGYLDRLQLVTRANGKLVLSETDLWGEPLDAGISRVLAGNLGRLTGSMTIQPVESFTSLDYTALLEVKVAGFDTDDGTRMVLEGTWKLQPVGGAETRARYFRIEVPVPVTASAADGRVEAMNRALGILAGRIADGIANEVSIVRGIWSPARGAGRFFQDHPNATLCPNGAAASNTG